MLKITRRFTGSPAAVLDRLSLPYDLRKRGRFKALTDGGHEVGLFIERGQVLQDGDLLRTECDQVIQIVAEPEAVVTAHTANWHAFARVCYHLGNRHVPLQIGDRWLRFQSDHVLLELAERYGLCAIEEFAPFSPENGAYGDLGGHSAHAGHGHNHAQSTGGETDTRQPDVIESAHSHSHSHPHDHSH